MTFKALLATKDREKISTDLVELEEKDPMPGDVTIAVDYSTVNYKDGVALTGRAPIIRTFPLIPGIDLSGTVEASSYSGIEVGDKVVANGWGLSQTHHGGYSQRAELNGDWLVKLPAPLSTLDAMAIGTAGYTAMLSVLALEHGGITPTGATSLSQAPVAASDRLRSCYCPTSATVWWLRPAASKRPVTCANLGAAEVIDRRTMSEPGKPLASERWARAVGSVGSHTLANVLAQSQYRGVVASCGLAQGLDLPASVLPFIMRNITLAGIDSVNAPHRVRVEAWSRLAHDLDLKKLAQTTQVIGLAEVSDVAGRILDGKSRGRVIVNVNL